MRHPLSGRTAWLSALSLALLAVLVALPLGVVRSADHRDSPLADEDPAADIADVYAFINPLDTTKLVLAMTVNGFAVPGGALDVLARPRRALPVQDRQRPATARKTWSSRPPSTASRRAGSVIRAARVPPAGSSSTSSGPAKPVKVGAESVTCSAGARTSAGCTNTVLAATGIRAWAGLADDPFVVDIGQLNRILGDAQDVFRDVCRLAARAAARASRSGGRHQRRGQLRRVQHLGHRRRGPEIDADAGGAGADVQTQHHGKRPS